MTDETMIERDALIFQAGDYPDKDFAVTEDELDGIVSGFAAVPVKIEHGETPFDGALGTLQSIWRAGKDLMGKLSMPKPAWDFLQHAGAKKLSAAVKRDKTGLTEVSIVANPAVAAAQIFHDSDLVAYFSADFDAGTAAEPDAEPVTTSAVVEPPKKDEATTMADTTPDVSKMTDTELMAEARKLQAGSPEATAFSQAAEALIAERKAHRTELEKIATVSMSAVKALQDSHTETLVDEMKRSGKIIPAAEVFARAILNGKPLAGTPPEVDQIVNFTDTDGNARSVHFAEAFESFLRAMKPCINFREELLAGSGDDILTPEVREMNRKLGVDDKDVVKYNTAGR
jgi:hypothetical protein